MKIILYIYSSKDNKISKYGLINEKYAELNDFNRQSEILKQLFLRDMLRIQTSFSKTLSSIEILTQVSMQLQKLYSFDAQITNLLPILQEQQNTFSHIWPSAQQFSLHYSDHFDLQPFFYTDIRPGPFVLSLNKNNYMQVSFLCSNSLQFPTEENFKFQFLALNSSKHLEEENENLRRNFLEGSSELVIRPFLTVHDVVQEWKEFIMNCGAEVIDVVGEEFSGVKIYGELKGMCERLGEIGFEIEVGKVEEFWDRPHIQFMREIVRMHQFIVETLQ
ncbi:Hypothetical_protein [Hexamita inflata]|uniref:Hypothetical_protein n=1 Tax=Hexamita inflata TaxID=28002 RepID=A0AA86N579_9EUKA|nr:Hypothetical protein HINF_LOCUS439 [Hexamita inflata]